MAPGDMQQSADMAGPCAQSETRSIGNGVFSFRYGLYSTMFVVGNGGVIAFDPIGNRDSCLSRAIQAMAPGLSVQHVIYSHGHHDHVAGATGLPLGKGVHVYAHRQAAEELLRQGDNSAVLPVTDMLDVNADGSGAPYALTLLGRRILLYYLGPTDATGNLSSYLPDDGVVMIVDMLFADALPGTVLASMSPQGVLRTLRALSGLSFQTVVTGHGPPATHDDVSFALDYWTTYLSLAQLELAQSPPVVPDAVALDGAPLLSIMQQLPVQKVLSELRPYYGKRTGFDSWGRNGFNFAYLFLLSESSDPLQLADVNQPSPPATQWQWVGEGAYYAQAGPYGSLVYDPDPKGGQAPLLVVDTLGANAGFLRAFLDNYLHGRKIGHIVYSHAHNDHIAFADVLSPDLSGVHIYAHENAARDLRDRRNPSVVAPTDIVRGSGMDLHLGEQVVKLLWTGPSHSDGNLVVYLPGAQVAMGVGLVQPNTLPGLLSVETDPEGLNVTLAAMEQLGAQIYLTGQGGYLTAAAFHTAAQATRDMLVGTASAMNQAAQGAQALPLSSPVAPALRQLIDSVGDKVTPALARSYPTLQGMGLITGNVGELGVTYCSSQSPSPSSCVVK